MPKQSGKAIAALVLGICGLTVFPLIGPIAALAFGYDGRREIDESRGQLTGRGFALAGIVLGWVGVALALLAFVFLLAVGAVLGAAGGHTG